MSARPIVPMRATPIVIAVVATFKRPESLAELLASLAPPHNAVAQVVVIDNASDVATREVVEQAGPAMRYIDPGVNLSCGGGIKRALEEALKNSEATHFWILDDDAKACPEAMEELVKAMNETGAEAAVPIVLNMHGEVAWAPGLLESHPRRVARSGCTPEQYIDACGAKPVPFSWSPWPSLMVSRKAIEMVGFPRDDFWITGEDVEFSMRITQQALGIFVPRARCAHLPPRGRPDREHMQHYLKFCTLLQNSSYIGLHLRHGRPLLRHLPASLARFLKVFGVSWKSLRDASVAVWWGAFRAKTAGTPGFTEFRERFFAIP